MAANKRINGSYTITTLNVSDAITFQGLTANTANVVIDGNLTVTGNATLSGNIAGDNISSGTTTIAIPTPSGNATVTVGGTSNVVVFTTTGISLTGNVTAGNVISGEISASGNVQIVRDASAGTPSFQFRDTDTTVSDGTVIGSLEWYTSDAVPGGRVTSAIRSTANGAVGNATVQIFTSDGGAAAAARLTVLSTGNVGIANTAPRDPLAVTGNAYISGEMYSSTIQTGSILATGNITSGSANVAGTNLLASQTITATGNVVGGNFNTVGLVSATGNVVATANVNGGNLNSSGGISSTGSLFVGGDITLNTGGIVSTTGNVRGGNIISAGLISGAGNAVANVVTATSVLQLPVYASNAARDTGISSPTGGMMVFVTDGDGAGNPKFQGYGNAVTGWTTL